MLLRILFWVWHLEKLGQTLRRYSLTERSIKVVGEGYRFPTISSTL